LGFVTNYHVDYFTTVYKSNYIIQLFKSNLFYTISNLCQQHVLKKINMHVFQEYIFCMNLLYITYRQYMALFDLTFACKL